jgi:ABC-2 type transport system permease protein
MFPVEGAAPVLRVFVWANPVSYAVSGLRHGLHGFADTPAVLAGPGVCLAVTGGFAILTMAVAVWQVRRPFFQT